MRLLGIDYGQKRVGIAVSDERGAFAFPRTTIENTPALLDSIVDIVQKEHVEAIALGDARSFSGTENPITAEVEAFAEKLKTATGLRVDLVWEAGSSVEASRFAPEDRGHDDAAAAAIILQRYLDTRQ